jgi:hypothetical protein
MRRDAVGELRVKRARIVKILKLRFLNARQIFWKGSEFVVLCLHSV